MITKLNVWLTRPTGKLLEAGELAVKDPDDRGALQGQFRYSQEYLESSIAFSLDPVHLPLSTGIFDADRPHSGVHGVFEDSLPHWLMTNWPCSSRLEVLPAAQGQRPSSAMRTEHILPNLPAPKIIWM